MQGGDVEMYNKPALQRFGSLRDLTLIGWGTDGDGGIQGFGWVIGAVTDGCEIVGGGSCSRS
jgi:hypothetical protein